jgi:hypothetical protein
MAKPKPVWAVLEGMFKSLELEVPLKTYSILGAWEEIVGDSLARQTQPRSIRNRILFIDVSHSTWIHQLQFLKPTLLQKVNEFLGETLIQDIRFKQGKIPPAPAAPMSTSAWQEEHLDGETLGKIEELLAGTGDEETKESIRSLLIKGAKMEQYRKRMRM